MEMVSSVFRTLLCDELRLCRNALEDKYCMGNNNALSIRCADYCEYTKSSQVKYLSSYFYTEKLNGIE